METARPVPGSIDEYIAGFPADVQEVLRQVRATIRDAAPDAEEAIRYQMPAFTLDGAPLVYFAGYRKHVGVYPAPVGNAELAEEMSIYGSGKGTAKFPLDKPVPFDLVRRIVELRVGEARRGRKARGG
jgi:uncharacterized protein YdhG (YjbR/CyaY superfamily)